MIHLVLMPVCLMLLKYVYPFCMYLHVMPLYVFLNFFLRKILYTLAIMCHFVLLSNTGMFRNLLILLSKNTNLHEE